LDIISSYLKNNLLINIATFSLKIVFTKNKIGLMIKMKLMIFLTLFSLAARAQDRGRISGTIVKLTQKVLVVCLIQMVYIES
jgi:hypothetical protein